jgi:hypothetical protein
MLSEKLTRFMLELSKNPSKVEAIQIDPESILALADLSLEEKEVIRGRNQAQLQQLLDPSLMLSPSSV